jgi:hypothetical protein
VGYERGIQFEADQINLIYGATLQQVGTSGRVQLPTIDVKPVGFRQIDSVSKGLKDLQQNQFDHEDHQHDVAMGDLKTQQDKLADLARKQPKSEAFRVAASVVLSVVTAFLAAAIPVTLYEFMAIFASVLQPVIAPFARLWRWLSGGDTCRGPRSNDEPRPPKGRRQGILAGIGGLLGAQQEGGALPAMTRTSAELAD